MEFLVDFRGKRQTLKTPSMGLLWKRLTALRSWGSTGGWKSLAWGPRSRGPKIPGAFFRGTTESILPGCITPCTGTARPKAVKGSEGTAEGISGYGLPSTQDPWVCQEGPQSHQGPQPPQPATVWATAVGETVLKPRGQSPEDDSFLTQAVRLLEKSTTPKPTPRTLQTI